MSKVKFKSPASSALFHSLFVWISEKRSVFTLGSAHSTGWGDGKHSILLAGSVVCMNGSPYRIHGVVNGKAHGGSRERLSTIDRIPKPRHLACV